MHRGRGIGRGEVERWRRVSYAPLDVRSGVGVYDDVPLGDGGWDARLVFHALYFRPQDDVEQGLCRDRRSSATSKPPTPPPSKNLVQHLKKN